MHFGTKTRVVRLIFHRAFSLRRLAFYILITFIQYWIFSRVFHWFLPFSFTFMHFFRLLHLSVALCSRVSSVLVPSSSFCFIDFPLWILLCIIVFLLFFVTLYTLSYCLALFSTTLSLFSLKSSLNLYSFCFTVLISSRFICWNLLL